MVDPYIVLMDWPGDPVFYSPLPKRTTYGYTFGLYLWPLKYGGFLGEFFMWGEIMVKRMNLWMQVFSEPHLKGGENVTK